jgi:mono/diheme cytochrome c family protein
MRRAWVFAAVCLSFLAAATSHVRADRATPLQAASPTAPVPASSHASAVPDRQLIQKYCVTCHNARAKTGGLVLESLDPAQAAAHADVWEKVVRKVRGGMMPPKGMPRPDEATLTAFAGALEDILDRQALRSPDPGHKPIQRLNRTEYGNAIRDLLDLDVDVTELLPPDDESDGFDNIAGVLRISPSLLDQYLSASRRISRLAVGTDKDLITATYRVPPDDSQDEHVEGLPLGTRGGLKVRHNFPQDGDYDFSIFIVRNIVGYMTGLEFEHHIEISVDGQRVFYEHVGGAEDNLASDTNMSEAADKIDARLRKRVHVTAGPHDVVVTFVKRDLAESDEPLQPQERNFDLQDMNGLPLLDRVTITGPYDSTGAGDTPSRRRIFVCRPGAVSAGAAAGSAADTACARRILSTLARRAYRRPVTVDDMTPIMAMYAQGRKAGSFDTGIERGLRLVLADPKFIFRIETPPAAPGAVAPVSDLELASRLSFFLWSSIPDDELLTVASNGRLHQPAVLDQQVRRMLKDPKADALVENFASQWLMLRNLKSHFPAPLKFPDFDNELRNAFATETKMFFASIMREDRSLIDFLDADYTFVNERLARHYGIPNVYGSRFRRVTLTDENRRGLLGQGSILAISSYPHRTSVVLRGKWILENILGTPPPSPPPNVPALKENDEGGAPQSLKARMETHRRSPQCASCHRVMDPLGFALENFDAIGEWRDRDESGPIDATGQLADGTRVDGPVSLRTALVKHSEQFVRTFTEKLITYALGRGLDYYDMPEVRKIARDAAAHNERFSSVVLGIVRSPAFQMKKAPAPDPALSTARASR